MVIEPKKKPELEVDPLEIPEALKRVGTTAAATDPVANKPNHRRGSRTIGDRGRA
jgi:hypothetical protein